MINMAKNVSNSPSKFQVGLLAVFFKYKKYT